MSTHEGFRLAEGIELASADIYDVMARRYRYLPEVAAVLSRLKEEELQHAYRLCTLFRRLRGSRMEVHVRLDDDELRALLADAERFLAELREEDLPAHVAISRMVALEERFACAHAEHIAAGADPSTRALFEALAKQDRAHAVMLEELLVQRPGSLDGG